MVVRGSRWDPGGLLGLQIPWRTLRPRWVRFPHAPAKPASPGGRAIDKRRPVVVGTAGHVDHGKTTLVKALTGVDTDRLPEEKAREISIELGFAPLALSDGTVCGLVDVPGHERFIKNMLAGATGVDVVLLCVDAREGVQPQTIEHLDILGLVGARSGVAALTKIDTIPPEDLTAAAESLSRYLAGTSLAGCPVVPVSARTGEGLDRLRAELASAVASAAAARPAAGTSGPARLPADRVFSSHGFGTVVTGTVASGRIATGQRLQVYPEGPVLRVRRLEVRGEPVPEVVAGERAAVNLAGDLGSLEPEVLRGSVLAEPGSLQAATVAGLGLRLLPGSDDLEDLQRVRLHAGTSETLGRVILLGGRKKLEAPAASARLAGRPERADPVPPDSGLADEPVVFEAEKPLALALGQAFVIRAYSPSRTIGGGTVLAPDLAPVTGEKPRSRAARQAAAALLSQSRPGDRPPVPGGFAPLADYLRILGGGPPGVASLPEGVRLMAGGQHVADEPFYASVSSEVASRLRQLHEARPHLGSVGREEIWSWLERRGFPPGVWLETLAGDGLLTLAAGRVRLSTWQPRRPADIEAAIPALAEAILAGGFSPPSFAEAAAGIPPAAARAALEALLQDGDLVCFTGAAGTLAGAPLFHRQAIAGARLRLEEHLDRHGEVTVAGFRDLVGSTRKYALPLLEYFDREKVTLRRGDVRVRHPASRREESS